MHHFMNVACGGIVLADEPVRDDSAVGHGSRLPRIDLPRVMHAVTLGAALTSQRLGDGVLSAARVILENAGLGSDTPAPDSRPSLPSRQTLQRARVRLDVAAMLCHRSLWQRECRRVFRYVAYDASPQHGVEVFATVERVLTLPANAAAPSVHERRLPLVTLGHGRFTLADKLQAHVHQTWLDYGPRARTVRRANLVVRQCLSDMGTEFSLADAPDVTHECVRGVERGGQGDWLYPFALQVPGLQHLLDTIVKDGLERVTWWSAWEGQAKAVCQWVHSRARREFLQSRLQGCSTGVLESLTAGCDRFVEWRWKTLANVTRDLSRMQDALRLATRTLRTSDFSSRDSVHVQLFLTAVQSDTFWMQSSALGTFVKPVSAFSAWVRGCPCHEAECLARGDFRCSWKGCRARDLSQRVRSFLDELLSLRCGHVPDQCADLHAAFTRTLAVAHLKFSWVDDLPFFIWQVRSPESAAMLLDKCVASQAPHHRATRRFLAGDLHQAMEGWAAGEQSRPNCVRSWIPTSGACWTTRGRKRLIATLPVCVSAPPLHRRPGSPRRCGCARIFNFGMRSTRAGGLDMSLASTSGRPLGSCRHSVRSSSLPSKPLPRLSRSSCTARSRIGTRSYKTL